MVKFSSMAVTPARIVVMLFVYLIDRLKALTDWFEHRLMSLRYKPEYVRAGACRGSGYCCNNIVMEVPEELGPDHWQVRMLDRWHRFRYNFRRVEKHPDMMVYACNYLTSTNRCSINFLKPKICRDFPNQTWFGKPNLHKGCGYQFEKREVYEFKIKLHGRTALHTAKEQ